MRNDRNHLLIRLQMDVTNRESIAEGKRVIQEKEGKLHILVNKSVKRARDSLRKILIT